MTDATPDLKPPPLTGDRVGNYLLGDVLGVGGMATVYAAHGPDGDTCAVKVLHPGRTDQDEARRFRREFLTLRALRHPGVVAVYESGRAGAYPWIAMERIHGTDLESLIQQWGLNPPPNRFELVEQIFGDLCRALAYVHSQGLIHRDLKPSNVLVTADHHAKLTDFGVVKAPLGQFHTQLTAVGSLVGTAAYMSPEQISGDAVDGRSDLYSLGAVLYVMLAGRRPILADTVAGYLARHLKETPLDPREHDPRVPPTLARMCMRLLSKDPAQRYATAEQVLASLDVQEDSIHLDAHGHDAQLSEMLHLVHQLQPGRGGLVVLSGPSGSGRTTLLKKFMDVGRADGRGASWGTATDPTLLDTLCNQIPSLGPKGAGGAAAQRIAVRTHGRPWVLVIDDFDEVDPHSLDQLTDLLRQQVAVEGEPLLIVTALSPAPRPDPIARFCSGATTGVTPRSVELSGLSVGSARSLLRDLGLRGAACGALARRLVEDGRIWPGQVVSQLEALLRDGWLTRGAHGALELQRPLDALREEELPVPSEQRQRLEQSLDRLQATDRGVLEALAVVGGDSDPSTLSVLSELTYAEVEGTVLRLSRRGMLNESTSGGQVTVRLSESWPQAALYELIPAQRRTELHRRLAHALRRQRGRPDNLELASHLLRGELPAEALPLLLRGASEALRGGRLSEAQSLLEDAQQGFEALEKCGPSPEAPAMETQLAALVASCRDRLGDRPAAQQAWEWALRCAEAEGNPSAQLQARSKLAMLRASERQSREAADALVSVWRKVSQGDPDWPTVTRVLAESLLATHRHANAYQLWKRLHAMGTEIGSPLLKAQARFGRSLHLLAEPDLESARRALARAELALRDTRAPALLARCLWQQARLAYARGNLGPARELALEAQRLVPAGSARAVRAGALAIHARDAAGRSSDESEVAALVEHAKALRLEIRADLSARIDLARAMLGLGAMNTAHELIDLGGREPSELRFDTGLGDPTGQLIALRARLLHDADLSSAEAWDALSRELPLLPTASARIALDAVHALTRAGDPSAVDALEEALERTQRTGMGLLRLEAAQLGVRHGVVSEADFAQLRSELVPLAGHPGFPERWQ